jgi:hypothetical protein
MTKNMTGKNDALHINPPPPKKKKKEESPLIFLTILYNQVQIYQSKQHSYIEEARTYLKLGFDAAGAVGRSRIAKASYISSMEL